jgi:hypothetical protein
MLEYLITARSSIPSSSDSNSQIPILTSLKAILITCILKKNLAKIGHPNQKLFNFDREKSKFPTVRCASIDD